MGYIHDVNMTQWINPGDFEITVGTWVLSESANLVKRAKDAADEVFTALIPITMPSNAIAKKGAKLESIDIWYKIATTLCDDFATVELEKVTLPATGVAAAGAAVTTTEDADHDIAAERKAIGDHTMTVNLSTPAWLDDGDAYWLKLVVDCAVGTVFTFFGARANFTLRV